MTAPTLFVAGAGGHLGKLVVEALVAQGHGARLIAGSRNPEALDFAGVETRKADFGDLEGFTKALEGVERLLIISVDVLGDERERLHGIAVKAAQAAGVKHVVYTSMPHPEPGNVVPMARGHFFTEQALFASGLDYSILRVSWYAEALLQSLPPALASGQWYTASGDGLVSYVARADVAKAAAGALAAAFDGKRVLTLTGPAALSISEMAAIASEVTGRPINVVNIHDDGFVAGLKQSGMPPDIAGLLLSIEQLQRAGGVSMVTDAVAQLSGEAPAGVRAFLEAHKAELV